MSLQQLVFFANLLLAVVVAYAVIGAVFGIVFVICGVHRIDPASQGAGIGFRLVIFPGVAALWPWLLMSWIRISGTRQ